MRALRLLQCVFSLISGKQAKNAQKEKVRLSDYLFSGYFSENRAKTEKNQWAAQEKQRHPTRCKRQPSADGLARRLH
ncbi:hypothetical protein [Rufibacter roseus]|uniref:Secreted protein n=1 Tax=Rufibacter roseus TaxID=1567108 RepID=A0ABW2DQR3_9BACT